jgi:hypothetical protein
LTPCLDFLSHGFEIPLHPVDAHRDRIDKRERFRMLGKNQRKRTAGCNDTDAGFGTAGSVFGLLFRGHTACKLIAAKGRRFCFSPVLQGLNVAVANAGGPEPSLDGVLRDKSVSASACGSHSRPHQCTSDPTEARRPHSWISEMAPIPPGESPTSRKRGRAACETLLACNSVVYGIARRRHVSFPASRP